MYVFETVLVRVLSLSNKQAVVHLLIKVAQDGVVSMLAETSCFSFGLKFHRFVTILGRLGYYVVGWDLTALFRDKTEIVLLVFTSTRVLFARLTVLLHDSQVSLHQVDGHSRVLLLL